MRTKPEKLNGHVIRPTYRYPGGPVVGVIVMRGRKLVGAFNPQGRFSLKSAWNAARRVACGRTRRWDEMYLIPWNRARRPDWLVFFGRTAVIRRLPQARRLHLVRSSDGTCTPPA
jgi:hypothetical protein